MNEPVYMYANGAFFYFDMHEHKTESFICISRQLKAQLSGCCSLLFIARQNNALDLGNEERC